MLKQECMAHGIDVAGELRIWLCAVAVSYLYVDQYLLAVHGG